MRVYISADIEGVTGVTSWRTQCGSPGTNNYDWPFARRMMTHDVNAAIRGAVQAGATSICVKDSHNVSKNLLIDELECPEGVDVELISGSRASETGMMHGIDDTFDAAFLVGYHAMAGTTNGVMEHTISGRIHRCWVNDRETGEQGISMYTAGHYGVPVALVTSDDHGCHEAKDFVGGIQTAIVKRGIGRHMARLKHPNITGPLIEKAAAKALTDPLPAPLECPEPVTVKIEFNRSEEVDEASLLTPWRREDAYTIEAEFESWMQAHSGLRRAMSQASTASP